MDPITRFERDHQYVEFFLKKPAIEFMLALPPKTGAQLFAKDKTNSDNPGAQIFIVANAKRIFRRSDGASILGEPASFYEWMGPTMKIDDETVKNTIDLDMTGVPESRSFNDDIIWVVEFVSAAMETRYKIVVPKRRWIVLKCDYDPVKRKYSAHLILHGFMWPNVAARKAFMDSIGLVREFAKRCPEADSPDKVVDAGVFGAKMLRLAKSTKLGKRLPLWPAKFDGFMEPQNDFDFFQKSMGSFTIGCELLEEPAGFTAVTLKKTSTRAVQASMSGEGGNSGRTVLASDDDKRAATVEKSGHRSQHGAFIESIVRLIDISKWDKYDDWLAIGIKLKSLALSEDEKFDIFKVVSQVSQEYREGCCENKWNKIPVNDHLAAENILRSWARQGNPIAYGALTGEKPIEAHHMNIIKAFVSAQFHFGINRIGDGITKTYDNASYIFVNIDETYCTLHGGEHDEIQNVDGVEFKRPNNPYIVIGDKHARLKCHNSACARKHGKDVSFSKYTKDMKTVVKELLAVRPEVAEQGLEPLVGAEKDYESVKVEFEKEWFALCYPAVYVQIKRDTIRYFSLSAIKHSAKFVTYEAVHTDRRGSKQVEELSFLDKWLNDPKQRHYDTLDFVPPPLECPPDLYNTFHGFVAELLPPVPDDFVADFEPIMTLLYDLCDHEDAPKEYVLSWLAHMVQLPAVLPRTGVIFKSKEGRGKNMLFGTLFGEKILGRSLYKSSAKVDDYYGRFANGFVHKILCNFNEVSSKHTSSIMGAVKETITEPVLSYEKKGADVVEIRNCARQLWFSNEDIPIKLSHDDRRWIAIQASESMPDNDTPEHLAYFGRVKAWIDDDRNVRAFYDFLKARDITNWKPDVRPRTTFYSELQQLNLNRLDQWLVDRLETTTLPDKILSQQLAGLLAGNSVEYSSKWVTMKMQRFLNRGVVNPMNKINIKGGAFAGRGRGFVFDEKLLTETMVSLRLMAPLFVTDDDGD